MIRMLSILAQLFLKLGNFYLALLDLGLIFDLGMHIIVDRCLFGHKLHIPFKNSLLKDVYFLSQLLLGLILSTMRLTLPKRLHTQKTRFRWKLLFFSCLLLLF